MKWVTRTLVLIFAIVSICMAQIPNAVTAPQAERVERAEAVRVIESSGGLIWYVVISTFISPFILSILYYLIDSRKQEAQAIIRRQEKKQDYERQDEVANRAAHAAELLLAQNHKVALASEKTLEQLGVIHVLVNSNMTAAMQAELDATIREHAGLIEIVELKKQHGDKPTTHALAVIESTDKRISELRANLDDRLKQSAVIANKV
jgi:hypothetical protein